MDHIPAARQTYRSLYPHGPARIMITAYERGTAAADAVDSDTGAGCVVLAEDLHASATLPSGEPRAHGYALETLTARAMNGHLMVYRVTGTDSTGRPTVSQWDAEHAENCHCRNSEDAEPLPDF